MASVRVRKEMRARSEKPDMDTFSLVRITDGYRRHRLFSWIPYVGRGNGDVPTNSFLWQPWASTVDLLDWGECIITLHYSKQCAKLLTSSGNPK